MKKTVALMTAVMLAALGFSGCSNKKTDTSVKEIVVSQNGWDSQTLHNEIAKFVVENGYEGYTVKQSVASSNMNWQALLEGEVALDIESWTDNVVSYQDDIASGAIVDLGDLVPDSLQGLYVPKYVIEGDAARGIEPMAPDLKTVKDLAKYADIFPDDENKSKGRMYGGLPGWMADEILTKKYEAYGLDEHYTYVRLGSEATLFASLMSAYNLGEPWLGYCYEPTWVTGKLDVVRLTDEPYDADTFYDGTCDFPAQKLKVVASKKFVDENPELVEFFSKYQTSSAIISKALAHIDDTGASHEDTAKWVLKENPELLDKWLPKANADKVRAALGA